MYSIVIRHRKLITVNNQYLCCVCGKYGPPALTIVYINIQIIVVKVNLVLRTKYLSIKYIVLYL